MQSTHRLMLFRRLSKCHLSVFHSFPISLKCSTMSPTHQQLHEVTHCDSMCATKSYKSTFSPVRQEKTHQVKVILVPWALLCLTVLSAGWHTHTQTLCIQVHGWVHVVQCGPFLITVWCTQRSDLTGPYEQQYEDCDWTLSLMEFFKYATTITTTTKITINKTARKATYR